MSNYIASKVEYTELEKNDKGENFLINNKVYTQDYLGEEQYIDDGVLDISYYVLLDENGEESKYLIAFDKINGVEDPQEWSDEYDVKNQYILTFN
ncbi:hypothetical protein [Clostridium estertheticum]|uniref:hypothetical protein n=1 Tax=Clostridium estertheticum TaxID=238834 RepID=UPI001C0BDFF6|nr:hypothetical protein [Clostridium estertheticum]MBU3173341.1 hypothetical protein [Clostridium estertheticum]